ncbi:hypothetical protein FJT64_009088 [Amphibalanus amphitrite]|uniref:Uncharacterized protein n=2 Tax=Amphibalanus amphitrite TaxID=1232801 RepID=A0A6A4VUB4_AMPAM|nr:hypothetical protein FJT64_009088 [Amphibalanus amphitrite]
MSSSGRLCLLVVAACLLAPAAVSAQIQFSEDWTHGKRDVSAQQQQLLAAAAAAADGAPRPPLSLLDVLSKAAAQQAAGQQCKPDAEALGLIYDLIMMSSSGRLCLLVVAACLLAPAAVSAQIQFSEDWTHGKRDVSAQQQQLLAAAAAAADGAPRPPLSLLDVLSKAAAQQAASQQCKPDAEALGLIYDLIMMSNSSHLCLLVVAACLLAPAAVSAQIQFSEDWTHGKRDVSAQQQQLLAAAAAAADGAPRPPLSLLDVLSKAAAQQAAGQQCKPDAEALGLIYDLIMMSNSSHLCLLVVAACLLAPAAVSAQIQFSEDWTHGKRDVSAQQQQLLAAAAAAADGAPRPPLSLLDVLSKAAAQQAAGQQCKPDAEALGLIYDLIMREVEKVISCRTQNGMLKPAYAA